MFSLLADKLAASLSLLFVEPSVLVESTIFLLGQYWNILLGLWLNGLFLWTCDGTHEDSKNWIMFLKCESPFIFSL
jgi:hypothetical protein